MSRLGAYDVTIVINNGTYNGKSFGFMLAESNIGEKEWHVVSLNKKPPYMEKDSISMVIRAKDDQMIASGIMENERAAQISSDIDNISESTDSYDHAATLTGFDGKTYSIMVDQASPQQRALVHEGESNPEYQVLLNVWSIYT